MLVALVDYGAGNLTSVVKGFQAVGADVRLVRTAAELDAADAIVVPGVGHFGATVSLASDWRSRLQRAIEQQTPLLGICLGLQWLFEGSDEAPEVGGLGLMAGRCFRLHGDVKVPHVGWNALDLDESSRLFRGIPSGAFAYFTHSYAAPPGPYTVATTTHGLPFAAAVERERAFGVQFHPEKSGKTGLRVLENFLDAAREGR